MFNNTKRLFSLILASVLLVSGVSCSSNNSGDDGTADVSSNQQGTESAAETKPQYLDDVPESVKFDGEDIRFICSNGERMFIDPDEDDIADPVNEAVWRRNNLVAERINVNITDPIQTAVDNSLIREVKISVTSGSDDYDIPIGHARFSIALLLENVLYRLDDLNYIDLEKDYWSEGVIENMALRGDHFWIVGDLSLHHYETTYIMMANAELWGNNHPDKNLYQIVRDGKWTVDALRSYIAETYKDLNGNGEADKEDMYGYATNERHILTGFFFAQDVKYTAFDDEDTPSVALNSEHTINVFEKTRELLYDDNNVYNEGNSKSDYFNDLYINNRAMFTTAQFSTLAEDKVRAMEEDFYVIPMPKYDEEQEHYRTSQQDGTSIFGVLNTVPDDKIDAVAASLEVMASLGSQYVIPVYYDDVLKNKYSRDPETAEMIDLIRNSLETDFALKWSDSISTSSLFSFLSANIRKDNISALLARSDPVWKKYMEKLVGKLEDVAAQFD